MLGRTIIGTNNRRDAMHCVSTFLDATAISIHFFKKGVKNTYFFDFKIIKKNETKQLILKYAKWIQKKPQQHTSTCNRLK